jgi:hypothetical protein
VSGDCVVSLSGVVVLLLLVVMDVRRGGDEAWASASLP